MTNTIAWVATAATITAAFMTASNLGSRITGYGFAVFTIGSLLWLASGVLNDQPALAWTSAILVGLDLFGVWRWLGRQAKVEEGGQAAAEASEATPGEALFPISILTHGVVESGGDEIATCIDAMAGCRSGRLSYLVVSQGGLAGVGETLRLLPWARTHVDNGRVIAELPAPEFASLEELPKDQWPAR